MAKRIEELVEEMQENPTSVRFGDLEKVCDHYFDGKRQKGSHIIYKMPWAGDPRVNIQKSKGSKAKAYQVRQVLSAIERLKEENDG